MIWGPVQPGCIRPYPSLRGKHCVVVVASKEVFDALSAQNVDTSGETDFVLQTYNSTMAAIN